MHEMDSSWSDRILGEAYSVFRTHKPSITVARPTFCIDIVVETMNYALWLSIKHLTP